MQEVCRRIAAMKRLGSHCHVWGFATRSILEECANQRISCFRNRKVDYDFVDLEKREWIQEPDDPGVRSLQQTVQGAVKRLSEDLYSGEAGLFCNHATRFASLGPRSCTTLLEMLPPMPFGNAVRLTFCWNFFRTAMTARIRRVPSTSSHCFRAQHNAQ